jgi:hypothetical protein
MIYPDFLAALACERSAAFPAEAETTRARQADVPEPTADGRLQSLRFPAVLAHGGPDRRPKATVHGGNEWTTIVTHSQPAG